MSIYEMLDRLEDEGKLVRYLATGKPMKRQLYLSEAFTRDVSSRNSAAQFFDQTRWIFTMFDRWVLGERITVRLKGTATGAELALLTPPPDEIWEFRIVQPQPQLRVFVRFAAPDTVVVLGSRNRDYLGSAKGRGGKSSKAWMEAMYGCEAEWNRIFGGTSAFRGTQLSDYISQNTRDSS